MTRQEHVAREIHVAFDLVRYLLEKPGLLDRIPDGAVVEVASTDRPLPPRPKRASVVTFAARRVFRPVDAAA